MFYKFEKATFLFFKKKFREISYISYTDTTKLLYLLAISGVGLGVGFPTRCRIILHLPSFFIPLFVLFPPRKRAGIVQFRANYLGKMQGYRQKNGIKTSRILHQSYTNPTSCTISYTLPYTRNHQVLLGVFMPGVGNVGDFQKTFFVGESAYVSEVQKHRTSLGKSTEVLPQKYGCFMQRSPMFSEMGTCKI